MKKIVENKNEQLNFLDERYRFKLDNFEGPLDLLLHLIKGYKLDIMEIKLSKVTEQYLEYMKEIPEIDMEKASEFLIVAATLLEIKSKQLLPTESADQECEEEDSEMLLLRRLKEYELFKQIGTDLKEMEDVNKFYRFPGEECEKVKIIPKDMSVDRLLDAFAKFLAKENMKLKEAPAPKKVLKDRFTVAEKIVSIRNFSQTNKKFKLEELFTHDMTKSEMINVFLALLDLLKLQIVSVVQNDMFDEINIITNEVNND